MTVLVRTERWADEKPLGPVEIDWANPLTAGLVGLWLVNEGAGAVRDLVHGLDGVLTGNAAWGAGFDGRFVQCPGTTADYIDIPNSPIHDILYTLTAGVIFTPRALNFSSYQGIWRRGATTDASGPSNINWMIQGKSATSILQSAVKTDTAINDYVNSSYNLTQDVSSHATTTINISEALLTLIVDGTKDTLALTGSPTQIAGGATKTWLGRRAGGAVDADIHLAYVLERDWAEEEIREYQIAPYQILKPRKRAYYYFPAAGTPLFMHNKSLNGLGSGGPFFHNPLG
ncbi:MAG: hypothetical protein ACE5FS_03435 [Paracoccaceae bacterium]